MMTLCCFFANVAIGRETRRFHLARCIVHVCQEESMILLCRLVSFNERDAIFPFYCRLILRITFKSDASATTKCIEANHT